MRTRQRILAYLQKVSTASAAEMARALGCTVANVRHHLSILAKDGRVVVAYRRAEGRGRPVQVYSLSPALTGDNLAALVDALLDEQRLSPERLAKRLLESQTLDGLSYMHRLSRLIEQLNAMHYQAYWEAGAEGPRILFGRCPYAAVIERHPELCAVDEAIIQQGLGHPTRLVSRIERGQGKCVFSCERRGPS